MTVIVNADTGRTLAMVPHRSTAALSAFLAEQGHRWCEQVKVVVTDGSRAYRSAIDTRLGHARHVLDRFHVIRWFSAGLTAVRRDVQRRQPQSVKPAFEPDVFRARFALLRHGDTLTDTRPGPAPDAARRAPPPRGRMEGAAQFHGLYTAGDHNDALDALGRFCDLYETGELPEFHDIVDTVIAWSTEILA